MTCREKLKQEHLSYIKDDYLGGCKGCPDDYGYNVRVICAACDEQLSMKKMSCQEKCVACWNQELEVEE